MTAAPRSRGADARQYGVAALLAGMALLASTLLLRHLDTDTLLPGIIAIAAAARLGGAGPGLTATALCLLGFSFGVIPPSRAPGFPTAGDVLRLALFSAAGVSIATFSRSLRLVGQQAEQRAAEARTSALAAEAAAAALRESEARYRTLIESIRDYAIFRLDPDGRVTSWNVGAAAITGYPADEIVGQPLTTLYPPEVAASGTPDRALNAAARDGRYEAEGWRIRRDGSRFWANTVLTAVRDEAGRLTGFTKVTRDLTARREAEASVATSEARLAGIIDSAMDAILTTDADQRIVLANRAAERVFGYPAGALLGTTLDRLIPERFRPAHRGHVARFAEVGTSTRAMGRPGALAHLGLAGRRRDGSEFPIEASISQVATEAGRYFTVILRDITEQRGAEEARARAAEALRASEERYALAARATSNVIWDWDVRTGTVLWSEGLHAVLGYPPDALASSAGWWEAHIHPEDRDRVLRGIQQVIDQVDGRAEWRDGYRFQRADGSWAEVLDRGYVARAADGRGVRMIGALEDVTAQRALEARLRQAQKMEAVGQLAGGVAHDFNNLLTIISGNLEFLREDLGDQLTGGHAAMEDVEQIGQAAERARGLVRQLLTFSRQQPVQVQRVQLGAVVRGAEKLLRRVIGEEIALEVHAADEDARVVADPGQLEQVLMNLAVNGRDAMLTPLHGHAGRGGALTLEVDVVTLATTETRQWDGVRPGRWVRLRVRDTGHGMDADTQAHAFEPFFTTKAVGQGTGLGLATVFGIVRQAGGAIRADSAPGRGTTFTILLPAHDPAAEDQVALPPVVAPPTGATILLVEDEAPVRATTCRMLERRGFTVLEARHGADALLVWREHARRIDLVVTDLRMPELGGRELVAALRAERPTLPVVYLSGYADQNTPLTAERSDGSTASEVFVPKPFTTDVLLAAVTETLQAAPATRAARLPAVQRE